MDGVPGKQSVLHECWPFSRQRVPNHLSCAQTCWALPLARPSSSSKVSWSSFSFPASGFSFLSLPVRAKVPWLASRCPLPHVSQPPFPGGPASSKPAPLQPQCWPLSLWVRPAPALAMPHMEGSSLGKECSPSEPYLLIWKVGCRVVLRADVSCTPRASLTSQGRCPSRKLPPEPVQCASNWPPHAKSRLPRLDLAPSDLGPRYNADSDLAAWGGA